MQGDKIGKYELLRPIGKGAMGEVFLAKDPVLGRDVAIKTIQAGSSFGEEAQARFEREAKSAGRLSHPNIVTVYDFGMDQGSYYMAMEYVDGMDLESIIRNQALPMADQLEALAQACEGLAYAHEEGIIHRDIKPGNILVTKRGKRILSKLTDFGVALVNQSSLTQAGTWMGTVNYMAPEYLDTGKATSSSDLFAVGIILYEILTGGRKPFTGESTTIVLNHILRHAPEPFTAGELHTLNPALVSVAMRALAKDPAERPASADALATEIREALAGERPPREDHSTKNASPAPAMIREPSGGIITVSKGGQGHCLSLKVALRQARPGTQINLLPGTYRESVVVDKDLTITGLGAPGEVVLEGLRGPALLLQSPGARVMQLTLRACHQEATESHPAVAVQVGEPLFEKCEIDASGQVGVLVQSHGTKPQFRECRFSGASGRGARLRLGSEGVFEDCLFVDMDEAAICVEEGARASLRRCRIQPGEGVGLKVASKGFAELEECEVDDRFAGGIEVEAEGRVSLRRCRLTGSRYAGLLLLEGGQAKVEDCQVNGHGGAGAHVLAGAVLQMRASALHHNEGFGLSVLEGGLATLEDCDIHENTHPGVRVGTGATVQIKACKLHHGLSAGLLCASGGKGVLEGCEIHDNAHSGAKLEPGGELSLAHCVVRDGKDMGLMLSENAQLTLEECVVQHNARGGIVLTQEAPEPILRGGRIEDDTFRLSPQGHLVKIVRLK